MAVVEQRKMSPKIKPACWVLAMQRSVARMNEAVVNGDAEGFASEARRQKKLCEVLESFDR